jgi:hypothetical protein
MKKEPHYGKLCIIPPRGYLQIARAMTPAPCSLYFIAICHMALEFLLRCWLGLLMGSAAATATALLP